jgi:hypothetical protein
LASLVAGGGNPADHRLGIEAFAHGATHAFLIGAFMMWTASLMIWLLLNVPHTQLAEEDSAAVG